MWSNRGGLDGLSGGRCLCGLAMSHVGRVTAIVFNHAHSILLVSCVPALPSCCWRAFVVNMWLYDSEGDRTQRHTLLICGIGECVQAFVACVLAASVMAVPVSPRYCESVTPPRWIVTCFS